MYFLSERSLKDKHWHAGFRNIFEIRKEITAVNNISKIQFLPYRMQTVPHYTDQPVDSAW